MTDVNYVTKDSTAVAAFLDSSAVEFLVDVPFVSSFSVVSAKRRKKIGLVTWKMVLNS